MTKDERSNELQSRYQEPADSAEAMPETPQGSWATSQEWMGAKEELRRQNVELTAARAAAETDRQRYRDLFDFAPDGYLVTDGKGIIQEANQSAAVIFNRAQEALVNMPVAELAADAQIYRQTIHRQLNRLYWGSVDRVQDWELQLRPLNGPAFPALITVAAVRDGEGRLTGLRWLIRDNTARKRAEEALRESEERYSSLFENNHAIMFLIDPDTGELVDANPAACHFYGYSREELLAKKVMDINIASPDHIFQEMQRARLARRQHFYFRHRLANGELRDVEVYSGPIKLRGKKYLYSIVHDVTKRLRAEEDLQRERAFVSAVLDTLGALVVVLDREGRIVRFNRACERTTGYTFDEVKGRCFWDLFLIPEETEPVKAVFEKLRTGDFPLDFENYWVTKEGRRRLIAWSNTALTGADETIEHIVATGIDITERRQAELEIRHLSSFPQLNPNPVLEVDTNGAVIFYNPGTLATLQRLGVEPDARLFLPPDMPDIICDLKQQQMPQVYREVEINGATFEERIYLARGIGSIRIFVGDITERKRAEERLRQFNAELQARNTELDAFAHSVAHDIKNPLQLIVGYAEDLAEDVATPEFARTALSIILKSGYKINSITDDLLLLSEVRRKDMAVEPLDMAAIITEARQRVVQLIDDQAGIRLPAAWPLALGYAPWVEEVWFNYLSNALKHAGRPACIELGGESLSNGMARFWIRDNGVGIAPADQADLFTLFYQVSGARGRGHGLGLSIVKRIVEKLGGEVGVQSSGVPGEGSIFSFTLPAA